MLRSVLLLALWMAGPKGLPRHAGEVSVTPSTVEQIPVDSVPFQQMRVRTAWRVKAGDDAQWAQPAMDDAGWEPTGPYGSTGRVRFQPFQPMWYRTHVRVSAGGRNLAFLFAMFQGPVQMYVNGVLVGSYGRFGPGQGPAPFAHQFFPVPDRVVGDGNLELALRTNAGPDGRPLFTPETSLFLGPVPVLKEGVSLLAFQNFVSNSAEVLIEGLLLVFSLALMVAVRREREYRALACLVGSLLASDLLQVWVLGSGKPTTSALIFAETSLDVLSCVLLLVVVRRLLRAPRARRLHRLNRLILFCALPFWFLASLELYAIRTPRPLFEGAWWLYHGGVALPQFFLPFVCLWYAIQERRVEPILLAIPLLAEGGLLLTVLLAHLHLAPDMYDAQLVVGTLYVKWAEASRILLGSALLVLVMMRTVRIARERAEIAAEMEAAQTVQQMLLGDAVVATPGFRVESAYLPASDVGGDFFFVAPGASGSLLVVAGDVSGKGLRAAMTVSAIVGALRSFEERGPAKVLEQLNRTLVGHMEGFATCCAALLEANGMVRLANAGHLSPYLDGEEMELAANLPLGITDGIVFEENETRMPVGGRLIFVSDGVVEAMQARSGELFGFERTAALTGKSARAMAREAKRWGQVDDITVVSVERVEKG